LRKEEQESKCGKPRIRLLVANGGKNDNPVLTWVAQKKENKYHEAVDTEELLRCRSQAKNKGEGKFGKQGVAEKEGGG